MEDTYYYREILIIGGSVAISSVIKVTMEQSGYSCTAKNMESHFTYSRMWTRHLLVQEDMRFFIFRGREGFDEKSRNDVHLGGRRGGCDSWKWTVRKEGP